MLEWAAQNACSGRADFPQTPSPSYSAEMDQFEAFEGASQVSTTTSSNH